MVGPDAKCADCNHPKSKHQIRPDGKCRAEQVRDEDGAFTQQFLVCDCEEFVPRAGK